MDSAGAHFLEQIQQITDTDYGDFMRKANAYLLELRDKEELDRESKIKNKLIEIQDYLQFRPNWDLDSTRDQLIKDAHDLILLEELSGNRTWTN